MEQQRIPGTPSQAEDFLKKLKTATAPMHQQLESSPLSITLMKPGVTAAQYAQYLAAMKEVIRFTETTLFSIATPVITDIESRRKLESIKLDLRELKQAVPGDDLTFYPFATKPSLAIALGFLYVVEGSTLGGRMILKHLGDKLFLKNGQASRFFMGYGEETGPKWKSFLLALSAYAVDQHTEDEIIEGAQKAFQSIYLHFVSVPVA